MAVQSSGSGEFIVKIVCSALDSSSTESKPVTFAKKTCFNINLKIDLSPYAAC